MLLLFFILWIIFNGALTLEIVLFGIAIDLLLFAFMCKFMDYSLKKDIFYIKRFPIFLSYVVILIWEVIKANIVMIKLLIIKQEYEYKPVIFKIKTSLTNRTCRMLLANSITLTPGTITINIKDDELTIHAIDKSLAIEECNNFVFERILNKLEHGSFSYKIKEEACENDL